MAGRVLPSVSLCLLLMFSFIYGYAPVKKFEYKLSFKGPHLVQKDGSIPFWDYGGDAIASDDNIRITPSLRSKKGWVWCRNAMTSSDWEIEVTFRVTGRGRIGADGLAMWYTTDRAVEGPVYGNRDSWTGLGIFFDSFDNDGLQNNPYILGIINDGTKFYDHQRDGSSQLSGGCLRDFRNKPYPIKAKIEYNKKILTVSIHSGMSGEKMSYELCFQAGSLDLPLNGYFGVTAATGGLADDHDVLAFLTHSYSYPELEQPRDTVSDAERERYEKEFQDYQDQLNKAKEDYKKEHPDRVPKDPYDIPEDKWFESQGERELKQIFMGQTNIQENLREVNRKMDEVIGRQERMLAVLGQMGQGQIHRGQGTNTATGQGTLGIDTMTRSEVNLVFQNHRELKDAVSGLRTIVNDLNKRVTFPPAEQGHGGGGGGMNTQLVMHEIKDRLAQVKSDTENLIARPQVASQPCPMPQSVNCLSSFYFFLFTGGQLIIYIAYTVYRQTKEAQAKKFY